MSAKSRWKRAGLAVKTANRFRRSRKSVVYAQLCPDRSDSDDDDDERPRAANDDAQRDARTQRMKERAQKEYNDHVEAKVGGGGEDCPRRLSVMLNAHGSNAAEEELETFERAKESKKWAVRMAIAAAAYSMELVAQADQGILKTVRKVAAQKEASAKASAIAAKASFAAEAMLGPLAQVLAKFIATMAASQAASVVAYIAAAMAQAAVNEMFRKVGRAAMIGVAAKAAAGAAFAGRQAANRAWEEVGRWQEYGMELRKMHSKMHTFNRNEDDSSGSSDDEDEEDRQHRQTQRALRQEEREREAETAAAKNAQKKTHAGKRRGVRRTSLYNKPRAWGPRRRESIEAWS
jgi:hypothetical protein